MLELISYKHIFVYIDTILGYVKHFLKKRSNLQEIPYKQLNVKSLTGK